MRVPEVTMPGGPPGVLVEVPRKSSQSRFCLVRILPVQGGFDPNKTTLASSRGSSNSTPGSQTGIAPSRTFISCLVYMENPYFFDQREDGTKTFFFLADLRSKKYVSLQTQEN